jgi:hypothetical protein
LISFDESISKKFKTRQNQNLNDANINFMLIELRRKIENNAIRDDANRGLGVFDFLNIREVISNTDRNF